MIRMNVYVVNFHMKRYVEDTEGNFTFTSNGPSETETVVAQSQDVALEELRDELDTDTSQVEVEHVGNGPQNCIVAPPRRARAVAAPPAEQLPPPPADSGLVPPATAVPPVSVQNGPLQPDAGQGTGEVKEAEAAPIPEPEKPTIN